MGGVYGFLGEMEELFSTIYRRLLHIAIDPYVKLQLSYLYLQSSVAASLYGRLETLYPGEGDVDPRHLEVYEMLLELRGRMEAGGVGFTEALETLLYAEKASSPIQYFPETLVKNPVPAAIVLGLGKKLSAEKRMRATAIEELLGYRRRTGASTSLLARLRTRLR